MSHSFLIHDLCLSCGLFIQELDTTRRSLEYSIYERERELAQSKLEEIDKKRAGGSSSAEREGAAYAEAHRKVIAAEEELDALKSSISKAQGQLLTPCAMQLRNKCMCRLSAAC